jgi:ABC-type transport system substrate-binding protein
MTTWGNQQGGEIVKSLASVLVLVLAGALVLAACSSAEPEVREVVKEVEVIKEVPVEVVKEVEVIKEVIKEVVKTEIVVATPAPSSAAVAADTTMAKDSTGVTFWSDLAASCETRGGHMNLGNRVSEFTNLNPPTINQVIQFSITAEVLSGLVQLDPELRPVPDLAESWEVSDDLLAYTFNLREGVKFHTGRPFTADDVVYTYDHQLDPNTQSIHTKGLEGVKRPEKVDDLTVRIETAFPRASFLTKVVERASGRVMTMVDQETIADVGEGGYNRMPVGAGPFKITEHAFGERLELEAARGTYYDPSVPCVDSVTMYNIPEDNTLVASLSTGEVDMIYGFATQFWDQLNDSSEIMVDTTPDVGFQMLALNVRGDREEKLGIAEAPWDDINVVYALGRAFDRDKFIERAFQGRAIPSYGPIPPGQKYYFRDLSANSRRAYDPDSARELMKAAGYEDGFEIKVLITSGSRVPLEVLGALLKDEINVTLIPDIQESAVFQPRTAAGEFQAYMNGSGGDPDPDDAVDDWFAAGSKFNHFGYDDPNVSRLNLKQKAAIDLDERLSHILNLSDQVDETFHGVFTHHPVQTTAYRADVKGYVWIHALRQLGAVWLDR